MLFVLSFWIVEVTDGVLLPGPSGVPTVWINSYRTDLGFRVGGFKFICPFVAFSFLPFAFYPFIWS